MATDTRQIDWRAVNALLATHLFGWLPIPEGSDPRILGTAWRTVDGDVWWEPRAYSDTWAGMGEVVEAMAAQKPCHTLTLDNSVRARNRAHPWYAEFWTWEGRNYRRGHAQADTAPRAATLAALMALKIEVPE